MARPPHAGNLFARLTGGYRIGDHSSSKKLQIHGAENLKIWLQSIQRRCSQTHPSACQMLNQRITRAFRWGQSKDRARLPSQNPLRKPW